METSAVTSDSRGLIWTMWLWICPRSLKFRCERSLVNCTFVVTFGILCFLLCVLTSFFGCVKKYICHGGPRTRILLFKIIFLAFSPVITRCFCSQHICNDQWCIKECFSVFTSRVCAVLKNGGVIPVILLTFDIAPTRTPSSSLLLLKIGELFFSLCF